MLRRRCKSHSGHRTPPFATNTGPVVYVGYGLSHSTRRAVPTADKPLRQLPYFAAWNYIGRAARSVSRCWRQENRRRPRRSGRGRRKRDPEARRARRRCCPRARVFSCISRRARPSCAHALASTRQRWDAAAAMPGLRGASFMPSGDGLVSVIWPRPKPMPLKVSVIVPDARQGRPARAPCIAGVLDRTDYPRLEIVIADNESRRGGDEGYLRRIARDALVRVVPFAGPVNFSPSTTWRFGGHGRVTSCASSTTTSRSCTPTGSVRWSRRGAARHWRRRRAPALPTGLVQHAGVIRRARRARRARAPSLCHDEHLATWALRAPQT